MSNDYIPGPDDQFDTFQKHFTAEIVANPTAYGLTAAEATVLKTASDKWSVDYQADKDAQKAARIAVETKNQTRTDEEGVIRPYVHKLNGHASVSNEMRSKLAIPPHDEVRSVIGAPTTRPLLRVVTTAHLTLLLHYADETTPKSGAKPHGAAHMEVWEHVGDPAPVDASGMMKTASISRTPFTDIHAAADAGKTVSLMARWVNAKGQPGPWSDIVTAKIPL